MNTTFVQLFQSHVFETPLSPATNERYRKWSVCHVIKTERWRGGEEGGGDMEDEEEGRDEEEKERGERRRQRECEG